MKVLVVGGGGREHALAWKLAQSPHADCVYVAPGNAGTAREAKCENIAVAADDIDGLLEFAAAQAVGLTVVGPEAPLVAGIVDRFTAASLRCLGPDAAAAQLEGSKTFTKDFLTRHGIPTASWDSFDTLDAALKYIDTHPEPLVVKADGLAAGKGVIIAATRGDAAATVTDMLKDNAFGAAGHRVVVEEYLQGEEASFICLADGETAIPFASSQDHKARDDGDRGPNTGGMGAYSPAPVVDAAMHERIMREVIQPTLQGMLHDGTPYRGFLYAGLMIAPDGTPKVLEFNCRFGDPETQPILMRLRSDLLVACVAALDGRLADQSLEFDDRACLGVVLAASGYPGSYGKGEPIAGLDGDDAATKVFHAGTAMRDAAIVTNGGRVLCVCALGDTVSAARQRAYARVAEISWDDMYYRRDIGYRAVARERGTDPAPE